MKKLLGIVILGLLLSSNAYADVAGRYKTGEGPLKISKNIADVLEYYFSGGKKGIYAEKQKQPWIGELIVISADGNYFSYFSTPTRYKDRIQPGHYTGRAISDCKKKSGQQCFLFASRLKIVWDNGSDKKKRRLKSKDIKAGKTLQILQELGFYDGGITKTKKIKKTDDNNIVSKLKDLKKLLDDDVITQDEFNKAKKKLLN